MTATRRPPSPESRQVPFLAGRRVVLRALTEADCDGPYVGWFNDAEVCRHNSHHVFPYRVEDARAYVAHTTQSAKELVLAITLKATGRHIGNIALQNLDPVNRSADFAIIIGEVDCWGKGYAKEASRLLLDHAFQTLNLHRVSCGTSHDNLPMQRLARALGMKREGRRRQVLFKHDHYLDVVEFGVLRSGYRRVASRSRRADSTATVQS